MIICHPCFIQSNVLKKLAEVLPCSEGMLILSKAKHDPSDMLHGEDLVDYAAKCNF